MSSWQHSVKIRGRFRRSTNLELDFHRGDALDGYIVTVRARELIGRIAEALDGGERQRAWSMFGPYGSGKSAFALFLAHMLQRNEKALALVADADRELHARLLDLPEAPFCAVLVSGSREPMGRVVLRALHRGLSEFAAAIGIERSSGDVDELAVRVERLAKRKRLTDRNVLGMVDEAATAVKANGGAGLLIVLDELGKMLEYAALHPEDSDVFLLQMLAERAARGMQTEGGEALVIVLTILHQAFDRYASRLSRTQQEEWRKVQGRYEDFLFSEPVNENVRILADAIDCKVPKDVTREVQQKTLRLLELANLPSPYDVTEMGRGLVRALPLDPAAALLVGPLFRKLAQNERSIFAFLSSPEAGGFLDVMLGVQGRGNQTLYRLDHLYDYIVTSLAGTLFHRRSLHLWAETDAALNRLEDPPEAAVRLLKQIALLDFAGSHTGLIPSRETLTLTSGLPDDAFDEGLAFLQNSRAVTYRSYSDEYRVWQGSDFDLESALKEAAAHISPRVPLAEMFQVAVPQSPKVALRHSYRTGTVRVFDVGFSSAASLENHLASITPADGRIVFVVPESAKEEKDLRAAVIEQAEDPLVLLALPGGLDGLREAARDLLRLRWVRRHSAELVGDAVARREVDQQIADLSAYVQSRLTAAVTSADCLWCHASSGFRLKGDRGLQVKLSAIADTAFPSTPEITNELINRSKLSSSATRALKLLIQAMLEQPTEPALGITGTPAEFGLYQSVLKATGMHRQGNDGRWLFGAPAEDKHGCLAVWESIGQALGQAQGGRVGVEELYELLSQPPYGVRTGLIPAFLIAFYLHRRDEIAFYEQGSFVADLNYYSIERLLKRPDTFDMQLVDLSGPRLEVLEKLAPLFGVEDLVLTPIPIVIGLLKSVRRLPPYTRRTHKVSERAANVRQAVERAVEPTSLLFHDLPIACEVGSFLTDEVEAESRVFEYQQRLQHALRELSAAYDELLDKIEAELFSRFGLVSHSPDQQRQELAERSHKLITYASDLSLKSFLIRVTDETLERRRWLESVASLFAKKSPEQWVDLDWDTFKTNLTPVARSLSQLEVLTFGLGDEHSLSSGSVRRVRVSVATTGRTESERVVSVHAEDEQIIDDLRQGIRSLLSQSGERVSREAKLAAVAELALELLEPEETKSANANEV